MRRVYILLKILIVFTICNAYSTLCPGHNMSVLGSQVDVDMDESVPDPVPKHQVWYWPLIGQNNEYSHLIGLQGHTGTGCYKLHDHEFMRPKHRAPGAPGVPGSSGKSGGAPANIMDLPVDNAGPGQHQLKNISSPAHRTPVREPENTSAWSQLFKSSVLLEWLWKDNAIIYLVVLVQIK